MKINWNYPTLMWVGENSSKDISKALKQLEISNPLFVTDKDLINMEMTNKILLNLSKVLGERLRRTNLELAKPN